MRLDFVGTTYRLDRSKLEKVAQAAFSSFDSMEGTIELKFISEKEMTRLNSVYREVGGPTDVLSFNVSETPLVGQVFICYTYTWKQAKIAQKTFEDEVCLLLVHGILHILGYDHTNPDETRLMQGLESDILSREGISR